MGEQLSREDARDIVLLIHCLIRTIRETLPEMPMTYYAANGLCPLYELDDRASRMLIALSLPQNLGSPQE